MRRRWNNYANTSNDQETKRKIEMKKLWQYEEDFGRSGSLSAMFFATEEQVENYKKYSYFLDEPLGKHSSVQLRLSDKNLTEVTGLSEITLVEMQNVLGDCGNGSFDIEDLYQTYMEENADEIEDE